MMYTYIQYELIEKMSKKNIETIRTNDKLNDYLSEVPKGVSYADWLLDKIKRLEAHEKSAVCWVVSSENLSPNRMSIGDENGSHPIFDEMIRIVNEPPRTNISKEIRTRGWLGQNGDLSSYALGGFGSVNAARTYIKECMGAREIPIGERFPNDGPGELYTTAPFDEYFFIASWLEHSEPEVEGLEEKDIEQLAEKIIEDARLDEIGILGDVKQYLLDLQK